MQPVYNYSKFSLGAEVICQGNKSSARVLR